MKKLLIERTSVIEVPKQTLIESIHKNDGRLIIKNVLLQRADTPNRNKRVYRKQILDAALNEYFDKIRGKRAFGSLDHPTGEDANVISLSTVCQVIKDAYWKENELRGDVEILNTPSGNIVKEILLAGYRVGQSSRGMGSVMPLKESDDDELVEVQDDFLFISLADCVSDPSTHNADMILGENKLFQPNPHIETKIDMLIRDLVCDITGMCCTKF